LPTLADLTDPAAIEQTLDEHDVLGRDAFLKKYGFGKAREYFLIARGNEYDSKAVVGAALRFQVGVPLRASEFSGGARTVCAKLQSLGYHVSSTSLSDENVALAEEVPGSVPEGAVRTITVNAYERSARLRRRAISIHGTACAVCSMSFGDTYGDEFEGFIHVHHLRPLAALGGAADVDAKSDLIPVCPNCHAALHHGGKLRSVTELGALMKRGRRDTR
jgi:5-methylcytosine-specific restriction protein A